MANLILTCLIKMFVSFHRWIHSECASVSEPPDEKCICVICREAQSVVSETEDEITDQEKLGMYCFFSVYEPSKLFLESLGIICIFSR